MVDEEMYSNYQVGDNVRVLTGSFEGVEGTIEEIDTANAEVTVSTIFFGRPTSISVKFSEVEKL
jgi:transcriptional antiterminator NusG